MLTPQEIAALRDAAGQITDTMTAYLLKDIARRISQAGQLTSTAAYEVWRTQQLGISQRQIKKELRKLLKVSHRDIRKLLTQAAEVGYNFDITHLPYVQALPFEKNASLQQMIGAAVKLAQKDFTNITQTLGMIDPFGKALPLQDVYRSCTDFAFKQVFTGAADYNTAIRQATANLAKYGVRTIDYEGGVHTSLEAAVRRNIMGGLGLMQQEISQSNHDKFGADGWEISAHAASAPDHEDIQGKQYSDKAFNALNAGLQRQIGTLNCGHAAFPIILGINEPQYSAEQLQQFKQDNVKGVGYQGRHYSLYEATQKQRQIETAIRTQKRRILLAETTDDKDHLLTAQIRLTRLNEEYSRFSKAVGLPTQRERAQVAGFGKKQVARATAENKRIEKLASSMYDTGEKQGNVNAWIRDKRIRDIIQSDSQSKVIACGKQGKHILGHNNYTPERSYLTVSIENAQALVERYAGTGELKRDRHGQWTHKEFINAGQQIGVYKNPQTGEEIPTSRFSIHYSTTGVHIVPAKEDSKQ